MAQINLLPWRELKREQEKKEFTTYVMLGVIVAALIVFVINYYALSVLDAQKKRNDLINKEITTLETQIKEIKSLKQLRADLIARMMIVQDLQSTRSLTVRLFDELIEITPEGVLFTKLERVGSRVTLYGYADSNTQVSTLMRRIETNTWFDDPVLTEIKKTDDKTDADKNTFKLSFELKRVSTIGIKK